jgi:hypothetical protein
MVHSVVEHVLIQRLDVIEVEDIVWAEPGKVNRLP